MNIIDTIIGAVSKVGDMFGNLTGLRIGGPLITGLIIIFLIWKLWGRIPGIIRIILIIAAVVMFSGSIANVLQSITGAINQ